MQNKQGRTIDTPVFAVAAAISVAFVLVGVIFKDDMATVVGDVLSWLLTNLGWLFVLSTAGFLIFVAFLALSPYGRLRLGKDDDRPEFKTVSWVAMMFSAGMGIGLMFFGVAEPISHLAAPPLGLAKPNTEAAAATAMEWTYFHWTLQAWALYAIVGLALGYFCFRKGMPNLISSVFYPLLGDRVNGPIGKAIDILAIFATMFGSATSLGLGALQINSGLNFVWGVDNSTGLAVVIIAVLTLMFVLSAVSGVGKGVQFLSNFNMVVAVVLLAFIFIAGPTVYILGTLVSATGDYFSGLVRRSFETGVSGGAEWLGSWTIFYWVWWMSWTPFVGTFLARISKGRTIREFVVGVLLIPSGVSFVWFAILGGSAINLQLSGEGEPGRHGGPARGLAVHDARAVPALLGHVVRRDRAGRGVLRQRRGRGVDRDGHADLSRDPGAAARDRRVLGHGDGRRGDHAAGRRRAEHAATGGDRGGRAVRAVDDRAGLQLLQGAARGGGAGRGAAGDRDHPRTDGAATAARHGRRQLRGEQRWRIESISASTGCPTRSRSSTACASSGVPASTRRRRAAAPTPPRGSPGWTSSPATTTWSSGASWPVSRETKSSWPTITTR